MAAVGWAGFLLYLTAQLLLALGRIQGTRYVLANCMASLLVATYSLYIGSMQAFLISIIWSMVSLIALSLSLPKQAPTDQRPAPGIHLANKLISIAVLAIGAVGWFAELSLPHILSWCSLAMYSISYIGFVFLRLDLRRFFLMCSVAAAAITPELITSSNYPTLALHLAWGITSLWGYARKAV